MARWKAFGAEARATFSARIGELIDHDNGAAERDRRQKTEAATQEGKLQGEARMRMIRRQDEELLADGDVGFK